MQLQLRPAVTSLPGVGAACYTHTSTVRSLFLSCLEPEGVGTDGHHEHRLERQVQLGSDHLRVRTGDLGCRTQLRGIPGSTLDQLSHPSRV